MGPFKPAILMAEPAADADEDAAADVAAEDAADEPVDEPAADDWLLLLFEHPPKSERHKVAASTSAVCFFIFLHLAV